MLKMFLIYLVIIYTPSAYTEILGSETGLKIPRFVSLKTNNSNLRIGPGENYPIKLKYIVANTPMEVIDEYKIGEKLTIMKEMRAGCTKA